MSFRFLNQFTQSPEGKLWEGEPAAPAASPDSGATPAAATPAVTAPQPATPAAPQAPATGAAPEGYVPSYRIRETREAAIREAQNQWQSREAEIRAEAQRYKDQLQALVGVTPPKNPEVENIRQQFFQIFPWAKKLEEKFGDFESLVQHAGDLQSQNEHYWQSYGRQTMDKLFSHASESMGGPLTDEGKRQLHSSFVGWVQSSPELTERYASDPTIVEDFWKAFTSSFIDPVRRTATAGLAGRAAGQPALPQDTPGGVPRGTPAPQLNGMDERAAAAWAQYINTAKR
jgi:hypothetical protein